jgi:hypothetical protein
VCARVLDWVHTPDGQQGYTHAAEYFNRELDHVPVPADPELIAVEARCDFCYDHVTDGLMIVEAERFSLRNPLDPSIVHDHSPLWLACTTCAALVQANRWGKLEKRVRDAHEAIRPSRSLSEAETRRWAVQTLYDALRPRVKGPPRPFTPEDLILDNPPEDKGGKP